MTTDTNTAKKRPDYTAHAVVPGGSDRTTQFVRIGVGFALRNGGISLLADAVALSGHVVLVDAGGDLPALDGFKHGTPPHAPHFVASMVRDAGKESYWTDIGTAYRHDGYVSVHVPVWPTAGKIILATPKSAS